MSVLRELTVDRGRSLIVVTHDPTVASHADARIVELRDGRVTDEPAAMP
jgi:ABC-type lipoprotein export system ATPase subunit